MVEARFVELTKAYKSLTDETIRKNWEQYGNPDGRQELSMGIALPVWVIEGKNNIWVLGLYGLVFGGALPMLVGRWWFGNQQKTRDGVNARTAAAFFRSLKEESGMEDVVGALGKAYQFEPTRAERASADRELAALEKTIEERLGAKWREVRRLTEVGNEVMDARRRALVLLYAHVLRLPVQDSSLEKGWHSS
jgi:translocation protein SEC63